MADWDARTLTGELVRLEPLAPEHEQGLWEASRDPRTWRWLSILQPQTREELRAYLDGALANAAAGLELPFATLRRADGRIVGSTRFLALRPEHRSIEIGWTWLAPEAWGTGANVEAKLLMLGDAFERLGCRRVELKTDALNERSRRAMEALPAQFEGVHRKHMLVRSGENRDTAWYSVHRRRLARGAGEPALRRSTAARAFPAWPSASSPSRKRPSSSYAAGASMKTECRAPGKLRKTRRSAQAVRHLLRRLERRPGVVLAGDDEGGRLDGPQLLPQVERPRPSPRIHPISTSGLQFARTITSLVRS